MLIYIIENEEFYLKTVIFHIYLRLPEVYHNIPMISDYFSAPGIVAAHVDEESRLGTSEASQGHYAEHLAARVLEGMEKMEALGS